MGRRGSLALVIEVLNATLNKETFSAVGGSRTLGPITIPSIGVEGAF